MASNTALHFNDPGLSRPDKRTPLCWQIFHIVDTFHAASANFTQRRITPMAQNKRKVTQTNRNIHFSKHKNPKQKPCDIAYSSEEELFYCNFHIRANFRYSLSFFRQINSLITLNERPHEERKRASPRFLVMALTLR